jgi:PEP-CTERM motif
MRLLSALVLSISSLFAVPYTVSSSGTFNGSAPTTTLTAPNQTWSFSFLIDSNPVPIATFSSNRTELPISGFAYRLNGSLVSTNYASMVFSLLSNGGGFASPQVDFDLYAPQMFSGTLASPTILPGVYTLVSPSVINGASVVGAQVTIASAVPEPASVGLSLFGLVGLGLLRRRTRN